MNNRMEMVIGSEDNTIKYKKESIVSFIKDLSSNNKGEFFISFALLLLILWLNLYSNS